MKEKEMIKIADWIDQAISHSGNETYLKNIHKSVKTLCRDFPLPGEKL